jgi:probable F420-dependent oxidoreductase
MLIDQSLIGDMSLAAAAAAHHAEEVGFDGVWATESVTDAFLQSLAAIMETERVQIGTAIAVAFARNPMNVAYNAWDLAAASDGRFVLGLGTQIKAHIERRFSMPWSQPTARMADFVRALRAIWHSWSTGERLNYEGEFYRHTLMSPVFTPAHHDHAIPIAIAAVGPQMTRVAGEVCDGAILHGMANAAYLDEVTLPALQEGLDASGRTREDVFLSCPVFLIMGDDEPTIEEMRAKTREQYAFYASTPAYRPCLDVIGYGDLQPELQELSRRGEWQEMGRMIGDDLLAEVAIEGTPEDMPRLVTERFGGRLDRVSSYFGWPVDDPDRLREILANFHAQELPDA